MQRSKVTKMDAEIASRKRKINKTEVNENGSTNQVSNQPNDVFVLSTSLSFTTTLEDIQKPLKIIKESGGNVLQIESRLSKQGGNKHDFLVHFADDENQHDVFEKIMSNLKPVVKNVGKHGGEKVPWFPRTIADLDRFADRLMECGAELDADHPGFTDKVYRARRKEFADIAIKYRHYDEIPTVEYTDEEVKTWGVIFNKVTKLFPTHACKEFNDIFPELVRECDYRPDSIPQIGKVSRFLKRKTGFTLRPVAGLLSSRDFLAGLAFRVFHSTQYVRHSSMPMFTPEPDVCHELIGHVPLFADPEFARFSQKIGLLSLGLSDEYVQKLANLYLFTVEFGLCRQNGDLKVYGAAILSSFGELQHSIESKECERRPFDPEKACVQECPLSKLQPVYFVAKSFEDAKKKLESWALNIPRPFHVHYNPYTESVEVIDKKEQLLEIISDLKSQIDNLHDIVEV